MHKNVMKKAMKLAYPLNKNKSFSPTKLKSIDAMSAPSLPEDADTPWHIADEAIADKKFQCRMDTLYSK